MREEMLVLRIMNSDADFKQSANQLINYLQTIGDSAAERGAPVYLFAHGGHGNDWRILTEQLLSHGLMLPPCVSRLCCSRNLFVAEKKNELGPLWSMAHVYARRFYGARIPRAHTAKGDVMCAARVVCVHPAWRAMSATTHSDLTVSDAFRCPLPVR
jgi:hypothetical protein